MENFGDFIELKRKEKTLERHPFLQEMSKIVCLLFPWIQKNTVVSKN